MTDYLLDGNNDLLVENGDFVMGDSTLQNQNLLLWGAPGAYKQYPTVGVGVFNYLKDDNTDDMLRAIRQQFTQDGMTVNRLAYPERADTG